MKKSFAISFLIVAAVCFAKAERPPLKVSVEPTEGEFVVFMPAAAKSSQLSTMGQIALLLKIENTGTKDLQLNKVKSSPGLISSFFVVFSKKLCQCLMTNQTA
jgi:hypothetical protein